MKEKLSPGNCNHDILKRGALQKEPLNHDSKENTKQFGKILFILKIIPKFPEEYSGEYYKTMRRKNIVMIVENLQTQMKLTKVMERNHI